MTVNFAHCFFEQTGTFKRAFEKMGVLAKDYDIQNNYGVTDVVCDLFDETNNAFLGKPSLFDDIGTNDLIIAFFPCIYFCGHNEMYFCGTNYNYRAMNKSDILLKIMHRSDLRNDFYKRLLQLFYVCEVRHLRLIVENPYNAHHFLRFNFPYKPAVIDMNRRLSGDCFRKPTQYFFLNCSPAGKMSLQLDKVERYVNNQKSSNSAGVCSAERSMISPDYAHNFICDHILGIESGHTVRTLFDN